MVKSRLKCGSPLDGTATGRSTAPSNVFLQLHRPDVKSAAAYLHAGLLPELHTTTLRLWQHLMLKHQLIVLRHSLLQTLHQLVSALFTRITMFASLRRTVLHFAALLLPRLQTQGRPLHELKQKQSMGNCQ